MSTVEERSASQARAVERVLPRWAVAAAAVVVAVLTAVTVLGLFGWLGRLPLAGNERATAQLDALRVGLSIGIGGGGVFALYLAARRQRSTELQVWQHERDLAHQQRVAAATEADAAERRVTDQYAKAADQLGSDRPPVRLAGLYALERLAQANLDHRQTVVNVICAYLRMPFELPDGEPPDGGWREELEVRRAAVDILVTHLQPYLGIRNNPKDPRFIWRNAHSGSAPANPKFWPDIDIDLSGATLAGANFPSCRFRDANFAGASFSSGITHFTGSEFNGLANFLHTEFDSIAEFVWTRFYDMALFQGVTFRPRSSFSDVRFHAGVDMNTVHTQVFLDRSLAWTEPDDITFHNLLPSGWRVGAPVDDAPDPVSATGHWCEIVKRDKDDDDDD